ncbi:MAG: hypothetical protein FVQ79_10550 [Planctomycetes bacterium]|nr:hypothetical protein [Planctomycetota bacterium]
MSFIRRLSLFGVLVVSVMTALGANKSHIGYLYPAGGQRGTVVYITAGGQFLKGSSKVYVSGEGVSGKVIKQYRAFKKLDKEQRAHLQNILNEAANKQWAKFPVKMRPPKPKKKKQTKKPAAKPAEKPVDSKTEKKTATSRKPLPDSPLLYNIEDRSLRELEHIRSTLFVPRAKQQPNRQLAELVLIEVTIDADAKPGVRELRIATKLGLTNPIIFQVGLFPEKNEVEPNNQRAVQTLAKMGSLPAPKPYKLPVLFNGQIMPGDVDRFRFRAEKGQQLVIETQARSLIPYLADAVPGWFQATVSLYDSRGNEVAYADDYSFNPDPVVFYKIARSGEYELEIRDSIYRGREDFVYRISVGQQPFITRMFPLGGKEGVDTMASIDGWNLPKGEMVLDTQPGDKSIRKAAYYDGKQISNSMPYSVDNLNELTETRENDSIKDAQPINIPVIVNGRIEKAGDVDVFRFGGKAGEKIVAEVFGRRLNSPLDSLLKLTDASGKVVQLNDDYVIKDSHLHKDIVGVVTHHADSYLTAKLPSDGSYYVHISDSQSHGSAAHGYRLRICVPEGDFALRVTPSSLSAFGGSSVGVKIHVLRKDGFDGEVELGFKGAPVGFEINGGPVPAGSDTVDVKIKTPVTKANSAVALTLQGSAIIGGKSVVHTAIPAEDMMQAFLYRHLVPSKELMINIKKSKKKKPVLRAKRVGSGPVVVPAGGSVEVKLQVLGKRQMPKRIILKLKKPPAGVSVGETTVTGREISFVLKADKNAAKKGYKGNLTVEAFAANAKKKRRSIGVLPAIPIQIVAK